MTNVKALLFDVFGTLVDWHSSIKARAEAIASRSGAARKADVDGARLAVLWRTKYAPSMDRVRSGKRPWCNLDQLHRESLDEVLTELDLDLPRPDREDLVYGWHELEPWPEVPESLRLLREQRITGALSNGHVRLLIDLSRYAKLEFDTIFSAELARTYKPDASVYQTAARLLDLEPSEVMLVACHEWDLAGAANAGLRTAFVARPTEWGPNAPGHPAPAADVSAIDLADLARKLRA